MDSRAHGRAAALRDVPRGAGLRVLRVAHVGRGLRVDADGEEDGEDSVHDEAEEGYPDVTDEHDDFADGDEEGEDGDDDVEVCDAVFGCRGQ